MTVISKNINNISKTNSRVGRSKIKLQAIRGGRLFFRDSTGVESSISLFDMQAFGVTKKSFSVMSVYFNAGCALALGAFLYSRFQSMDKTFFSGLLLMIGLFSYSVYKAIRLLTMNGFKVNGDTFIFDSYAEKAMFQSMKNDLSIGNSPSIQLEETGRTIDLDKKQVSEIKIHNL